MKRHTNGLSRFIAIALLLVVCSLSLAQRDDERIVFMSDRDGNREIYTMNADGSDVRRLTNNDAQDLQPVWSPDKSRIAFVSNREGKSAVYIMNADGSNQRRISTDQVSYHEFPSWSPDGRYLAYTSDRAGSLDIYVSGVDGSNPQRLTTSDDSETEPSWSPDGRQIAYLQMVDGLYEVYVVPSSGGTPQRIAGGSEGDYFSPRWSPDGRMLAYSLTVFDQSGNSSDIYLRDMQTGRERLLVSRENSYVQGISWSANGEEIVYQIQPQRESIVIHRISVNDGTFRVLTEQAYNSEMPSWSTPFSSTPTTVVSSGSGGSSGGGASCPGLPDAIVRSGERARVSLFPGNRNNVRAQPSTGARRVTQIDPGQEFSIIDGPTCANGFRWWRIQTDNGTTGWTADSDGEDYWIEPVSGSTVSSSGGGSQFILLQNGRGLTNGRTMNNGEFQVEGYCSNRGYGTTSDNNYWHCTRSGAIAFSLRQADFDQICRETYNNSSAVARQSGSGSIPAYRWRCYAGQTSSATTTTTTSSNTGSSAGSSTGSSSSNVGSSGDCWGAMASLFTAGDTAVVDFNGMGALRVLQNYQAERLVTISQYYDNDRITLLEGPECYNGVRYWRIFVSSMNAYGWVAEGRGGDRFLCPVNNPECS